MKRAVGLTFACILLILGLTAWAVVATKVFFPTPAPLPVTKSMPAYAVVYPKPEQIIHLSEPSGTKIVGNMPVMWEPGFVCVTLDASHFLQNGDFWSTTDILELASLTLNGQQLELAPEISDGLLSLKITEVEKSSDGTENAVVVASLDGGPYGICWQGSSRTGLYVAEFRFRDSMYAWWYRLEP
jgi:hypothetical protein